LGLLIATLPLVALFGLSFWIFSGPTEVVEVSCFDRYGNEILGVVCEADELTDPLRIKFNNMFFPFFALSTAWGIGFVFAWFKWWSEDECLGEEEK